MKLLYLSPVPIDFNNLDGVQKKILSQAKVFNTVFDVDIIYCWSGTVYLHSLTSNEEVRVGKGKNKLDVIKSSIDLIKKKLYSRMYIRYPRADHFFIQLLKTLKSNNVKAVIEIPTFPYDSENFTSLKSKIISVIDRLYRGGMHRYIERIVTYSNDEMIFGIKTIRTVNGINFENNIPCYEPIDTNKEIRMIAVSAMFKLHGYDRIISGISNYYKAGGARKITLVLVGKGDEYSHYKQMAAELSVEDRVLFPGTLFGEDLNHAYEKCSIGLNSLAIHREGLTAESTLKTKEYASRGLPIASSSYVDAFSESGNEKYVFRVPANDDPIDIEAMIRFIDLIYTDSDTTLLRNRIREDAFNICDMKKTLLGVIDYLNHN